MSKQSSKDLPVSDFFKAAKGGDLESVHSFFKKDVDPNVARSSDGSTALMIAAKQGHLEVVKCLLSKGALPNVARSSDGSTALMLAAEQGHPAVVKCLLSNPVYRVDTNVARSSDRATARMLAAKHGHWEIVESLTEALVAASAPLMLPPALTRSAKGVNAGTKRRREDDDHNGEPPRQIPRVGN